MTITLNVKPLSINQAWQGRRFKTPAAKQYDRLLGLLLPKESVVGEYYYVEIDFHLKNFSRTDIDNLVKPLLDCIVRQGIIKDDRRIVELRIRKFKTDKNWIEVQIDAVSEPHEKIE